MIIKSEKDLAKMKEIGQIVALTLKGMCEAAKPGMTTKELDEIGHQLLKSHGAVSAPISMYKFPGHNCISVNEEVAHGIPGSRVLQKGDMVNIDVSAHKNGYYSDNGASIVLGEATAHQKKLMQASKEALNQALSMAKAGNKLNTLGLMVEKTAHRYGFSVVKNLCGHGIGRTLHDEPECIYNYYEKRDQRIIENGMVLAVETFVSEKDDYVYEMSDGWTLKTPNNSQVAQFEHTIMVTEEDPLILTLLAN
ncbi:MAG: type I methionyl aminopeptidase [Bacillota bacterium]|jgi:methionyl aminopeptidase